MRPHRYGRPVSSRAGAAAAAAAGAQLDVGRAAQRGARALPPFALTARAIWRPGSARPLAVTDSRVGRVT